ncbi:winged helix-turn-helix domain-containing protein, partial [Mammaliicoccus stepanovicii]
MNRIEDLTKILLEEKSFNILRATSENPKTTKEISKCLNISSSNLYYTINKLTGIGALKIVEKTTIGNLIEHKYSSSHIFDNSLIINNE